MSIQVYFSTKSRRFFQRLRGIAYKSWVCLFIFTSAFPFTPTFENKSVKIEIKSAEAASGDVILLWDTANGSIPSGWTCISCTSGDAFYQLFPRASSAYGSSTAGADTHTHTLTFSSDVNNGQAIDLTDTSFAGSSSLSHTHSWGNMTSGSGSVVPPYKHLKFIKKNSPTSLPANIIAIFDTTVPSGWTRYSSLDGNYLRGGNDNATGGASTHTHSTGAETSTSAGGDGSADAMGDGATNGAHTHSISASSTAASSNGPPYIAVVFGKLDADAASLPAGMIALFDNSTLPANWNIISGTGSVYYQQFLQGASSFGSTGGSSATHNHGGSVSVTSGVPNNGAQTWDYSGPNASFASQSHTHNVTFTIDSQNTLPVYRDVILGQYEGTATAGDVIMLWDTADGSIPSGWTCISCTGGDAFYGVFPRASDVYTRNYTSGADTGTHTLTYSSATAGADSTKKTSFVGSDPPGNHTHTWGNPTVTTDSIVPPYKNLKFIKKNNPASLPANIIGLFDATVPSGWTRYSALDSNYLRGYSDNATGGASTHTHTYGAVTSGSSGGSISQNGATGAKSHTHTLASQASTSANNDPPYITMIFGKLNADGSVPVGLIAMFDNSTFPVNWTKASTDGSSYQNKLMKGSSTFGTTGGNATHNHGGSVGIVSGAPSSTGAINSGTSGSFFHSTDTHTHTVTYTISSSSNWPVYRDVMLAKYVGYTISGIAYDTEASGLWTGSGKCDGSTTNVSLSIGGATKQSVSCNASTAAFSFTSQTGADGTVAVFFLDTNGGAGGKGVTYTKITGLALSGISVTKNFIRIRNDSSGSITNANISTYDKTNDTDIPIDSDGTNSTGDSGFEMLIESGKTFAPGGNVTLNNIQIVGTYTGVSETLTLTAAGTNSTCTSGPGTAIPLCVNGGTFTASTNTVKFNSTSALKVQNLTYYNLNLSPSAAGTPTYILGTAALQTITVHTITVTDGTNPVSIDETTYAPTVTVS